MREQNASEVAPDIPDDSIAPECDLQFCSYCSEAFPMDDPMVDYEGQTFCSPNCVRDLLSGDDCDHACYVAAVNNFNARFARIMAAEPQEEVGHGT